MSNKTVTAFFESYDDAAQAVGRLESAGVPSHDISLISNNEGERYSRHANGRMHGADSHSNDTHADDGAGTGATVGALAGGGAGALAGLGMLAIPGFGPVVAAGWLVSTLVGAGAGAAAGGLTGALVGAGVDENDAHAYAEGVRRGGALVTVRASESEVNRVVDILDDEGTVDFDERENNWRGEGWTGGRSEGIGAAGSTATGMGAGLMGGGSTGSTSHSSMEGRSAGHSSTGTGREEVIPVVEEELRVGKREVNRGRVRIHSHVVERPVHEQVTLREEHVEVERRPASGAMQTGAMGNQDLFRERTIEVEESSEEAVVSKEARVKEELVVRKESGQRTETVSDTVRSTEVEIEDERGKRVTGTDRDRT